MNDTNDSDRRDALLAAAARVAPTLAAVAADSEAGGTLARAAIDALDANGLFAMAAPRAVGGAEADVATLVDVFAAVARADTSAGWALMISSTLASVAGAYLPEAGAREVFADRVPTCAGLVSPAGVARPVDGGFRVDGRWGFGSGVRHARWIVTSAVVASPPSGGPPPMITVVVPASDVRIEDTWRVAGLRGTGSDHYAMRDVFVPAARTFTFPCAPRRRGGALFDLPLLALLAPAHVGFAIGAAEGALDAIVEAAPKRVKTWTRAPVAEHPAFSMDLGRTSAKVAAARALGHAALGAAEASMKRGEPLEGRAFGEVRAAVTWITEVAAEAATFAFRSGGASALYEPSPLARRLRDAHAAAQHVAAADDAYEFAARARLGQALAPHPLFAPRAPAELG